MRLGQKRKMFSRGYTSLATRAAPFPFILATFGAGEGVEGAVGLDSAATCLRVLTPDITDSCDLRWRRLEVWV